MGQVTSSNGAVIGTRDPEQLREEIEATRRELSITLEALVHKTDPRARAREKIEHTRASVAHTKDEWVGKAKQATPSTAASAASRASHKARENPLPLAVAASMAAGFAAGRILRR